MKQLHQLHDTLFSPPCHLGVLVALAVTFLLPGAVVQLSLSRRDDLYTMLAWGVDSKKRPRALLFVSRCGLIWLCG